MSPQPALGYSSARKAPASGGYKEYYIRDAQGNVMATYRYTNTTAEGPSLKVTERPVYGSKRLGSYTRQMELYGDPANPSYPYIQPMQAPLKHYELTDHLGNVAAVVTGRLLPGNNAGSQFQPELVSAHGYEPFGSLLPGRNYSSDSYRWGFNGIRKDDEVYGATGTSYDFGARMYDPRVGRWLSLDPLARKYPGWSPYTYCIGNPILLVDHQGKEPTKAQAGTVEGFVAYLNNTRTRMGTLTGALGRDAMMRLGKTEWSFDHPRPMPATTAPFNNSPDKYIYTEKGGWLDMAHFMFYAGRAYDYKMQKQAAQEKINRLSSDPRSAVAIGVATRETAAMDPVGEAVQDGYMQEMSDRMFAKHSAYSYEDLPSDKLGADFGANYYDPNSKLSLGDQLSNYLKELGAIAPQDAPNYNSLPDTDPTDKPTRTNHTTTPVFTNSNP